jgi:hypothetical protein
VTVQGYDADTAKYDDVTANFTGTLQNGGSNVLVDTDIGVNVQAYDAQLADVAGLTPADGSFIVGDGANFVAESGATARTSLGLGSISTQAADNVNIDGGAVDGVTLGTNSAVTEAQIDNVNINGNTIVSSDTDGDLSLTPNGTGDLILDGLKWPQADGTADYVLKTDGSGQLAWAAQSGGGGTPGGSDTQIQYNSGGSFAGASGLVTDGSNLTLNAQGDVRFADSDSSNWVAFQAPATVASNVTWTLPDADGTDGQVIKTNGSGTLSWITPAAGGGGGGTSVTVTQITATASQTDFSVTYTVGQLSVYLNGALLASADYTATNGTTVVLAAGAASGDIFTALAYDSATQITQGDTKVEVTDSGTGKVEVTVDNVEVADFTTGAIVFNETGANQDFRVEGDTNANLLFVDASTDRVGIGASSPNTRLEILESSASLVDSLTINNQNTGGYSNYLVFRSNVSGTDFVTGKIRGAVPSANNGGLAFETTASGVSTERVRITSGGDFLINETSASAKLEVANGAERQVSFRLNNTNSSPVGMQVRYGTDINATGNRFIDCIGNATTRFLVFSNGNVQNTNNSYGQISDEKLKQDIVDAGSQWEDIKNIQVKKFRFKENPDGVLQIGVIAQELELVSPGLVDESVDYEQVEITDGEGNVTTEQQATGTTTKSVKYSVLYMKAVKALQEAMERIETLEAKVAALEAQ